VITSRTHGGRSKWGGENELRVSDDAELSQNKLNGTKFASKHGILEKEEEEKIGIKN
jgi:hypothetical protein